MDDIDLGRGPDTTTYHVDIPHLHSLSLKRLNLKYVISMALILLIKYLLC